MFCYVLGWAAVEFFIQYSHLNFHSFSRFQHGSGLSVKGIMPLSATLSLAIGLKFFWFLIALLLYPKSAILAILALSFLDPKDLYLSNQLSRGSWQMHSVSCTYLTWCQRRNGCFNDWINTYFQSFICLPRYGHFLASIFCKVCLALLNRVQPILERLKENIIKPWKPSIIDRSKWC